MLSYRDFEFIKIIGSGSFGKVFLARYIHNNNYYAIKRMDKELLKETRQLDNIYNESLILQDACMCPFIIKFYHTIESESYIFIVMEYVQGGELFFYIKKYKYFTENIVKFFIAETIIALNHLHDKNILYRDLKPENILITSNGHIKLADFGFATRMNDNIYMICGTPDYMAPEKLLGQGDSKETDYWSLGCLAFEMLLGLPPFYDAQTDMIYKRILNENPKIPEKLSSSTKDFLSRLLLKDRTKRLGHNGIKEIMEHEFFKGTDWDKIKNLQIVSPIKPKLYQFVNDNNQILCEQAYKGKKPTLHTYRRIFKK